MKTLTIVILLFIGGTQLGAQMSNLHGWGCNCPQCVVQK